MSKETIAEAATIEEAISAAKAALGVDEDADVEFEILAQPRKKTLGLFGGSNAKVRAFIKDASGNNADAASKAVEYLSNIISLMGADIDLKSEETDDGVVITLSGDGVASVIGHHGETLNALQYLTGLACNKGGGDYYRVTLNSGNYREKREESLTGLANAIAQKAIKNQRNYTLEPMNPYERRIIHTAVQKIDGVTSWSTGEASNRRVVIGTDENDDSRTDFYRSSRGGRGNGNRRGGNRGGYRGGRGRNGSSRPAYTPAPESAREKKTEHDDVALYGKLN